MWVVLLIIVLLFGLYLFLIAPNPRKKDCTALMEHDYAHRGLFDNKSDAPENSLAAFRKAVEAGYGIELDVQKTTDGKLVVFHDNDLDRMCGTAGRLRDKNYEEIAGLRLLGTEEKIPLFDDVLALVGGRVPLIVEIKEAGGDTVKLTEMVHRRLSTYSGPYCVESFHPLAMRWYKKNAKDVVRGQLAYSKKHKLDKPLLDIPMAYLLMNVLSRPDFVAYDFHGDGNLSMALMRGVFKPLLVAWTVRSREEASRVAKRYQLQIFEGFLPNR